MEGDLIPDEEARAEVAAFLTAAREAASGATATADDDDGGGLGGRGSKRQRGQWQQQQERQRRDDDGEKEEEDDEQEMDEEGIGQRQCDGAGERRSVREQRQRGPGGEAGDELGSGPRRPSVDSAPPLRRSKRLRGGC